MNCLFYIGLHVKEIAESFKRHARDPLTQLLSSKSCIRELFKVLLCEMKGFKYQITLHATLKKNKLNSNVEYAGVYLNSFVKIVINDGFEDGIDKCFEEFCTSLIIGLMKDLAG